MARSQGPHVLVFPFPAQGHMLPLLDLAYELSARGVAVTVAVTPKNLPLLDPLLSRSPTVQPLVLPFPAHPSLPPGVESLKDLPPTLFPVMMRVLGDLHGPLLRWARSSPSPLDAIISDFFLGWTQRLETDLGIPRLVFSPSGALTLSTLHCLWRNMPKRDDENNDRFPVTFSNIPKSPTYSWYQISSLYRAYKEGDPMWEFIREGLLRNIASWGFVFNTFDELEGPYLAHLRRDLGHPRVWAVGPLSPPEGSAAERGGGSIVPSGDVVAWLDGYAKGSVVYVCFGSQLMLTRPQTEAVAAGLERSRAPFLWCVKGSRATGDSEGAVPDGFEERVAGRGLVIRGWAPQVAILNHRAVGSFLTHCGWNSVLEGIMAGVVLLTWPMRADQFLNARLLLEEMGVCIKVCEGYDSVPDPDELARVVAESVGENREERTKACDLRRKALAAVKKGGNSYKDLDGLAELLSRPNLMKQEMSSTK